MRILFLSHKFYPDIGGIEVNSEVLATEFTKRGHEVRLLTWTKASEAKSFPFEVLRDPSMFELIRQHQWAEVVFENNPCLRLAWPSLFIRKPLVIALRTWIKRMTGELAWQDKLKFRWLRRASQVIAVSEAIREECWAKATVIGNPYRIETFKVLPETRRTRDFVFLGRLVSDKGADLAIQAFDHIVKSKFYVNSKASFTMTIIGDGPEMAKLKSMVTDRGISDAIQFTGSLQGQDLVRTLNSHKYLLVPSIWREPFGNVALEGLACGCLPIVSSGGGLTDAVGNAGLVFERQNANSMIMTILNLLKDPELEVMLRQNAPGHLQNHHPEVVADRYLKIIERAVKQDQI